MVKLNNNNITIYNEDCINTMKKIKNNSIDMILTSPPYDNIRNYHNSCYDFISISKELFRIIKIGGALIWIVKDQVKNYNKTGTSFENVLNFKKIGFNYVDTMIWQKYGFTALKQCIYKYPDNYEFIFILSKGKLMVFNPIKDRKNVHALEKINNNISIRRKNNILYKGKAKNNSKIIQEFGIRTNIWKNNASKSGIHPATFPVNLISDLIISWTNENELIYDPFIGSGTTAIASLQNNRKCIGSEISFIYYSKCITRIKNSIKENGVKI
jgi:site-specific DNA-methyltransferase (adenine-specific)